MYPHYEKTKNYAALSPDGRITDSNGVPVVLSFKFLNGLIYTNLICVSYLDTEHENIPKYRKSLLILSKRIS